jgi:hypothetical protein
MPQKFANLIKEWGKYGGVWCKGVQCSVIGELKEIKISSLKSWTVASLPLAYKEIL